jgi:predicted PurR-regulated permease PerM
MDRNPWLRTLIILLVFIAGLFLVGMLWQVFSAVGDILLLFFLSWLIAFTLNPLAQRAQEKWALPWPLAVVSVYAGVILALLLGFLLILPTTVEQGVQLGTALPRYGEQAPKLLDLAQAWLRERGFDVSQIPTDNLATDLVARAQTVGSELASWGFTFAQAFATAIFNVVLILILSFYMSLDGEQMVRRGLDLLPEGFRAQAEVFLNTVGKSFGGYLRGVLVQGVIYGLCTAVVMYVAGLPFVAVVAIFAGLMMIVPIIGSIIAMVPPVLLALFTGDWGKVAFVFVTLFVVQQLLLNLVMPRVMSQSVGLHPLIVFAALLIGGRLAGIWGAVFGVPVAAVGYSMASYFFDPNRRSRSPSDQALATTARRERNLTWMGELVRRRRPVRRARAEAGAIPVDSGTGSAGSGAVPDERPAPGDVKVPR